MTRRQKIISFVWLVAFGFAFINADTVKTTTSVDQTTATIQALRLNGIMAGGVIPPTDPVFANMVSAIETGNYQKAAAYVIDSKYFPYYLPRRMAKEMMNPEMSEAGIPDNDDVAFIVANLLGLAGTQPSIGSLWSQNATYCVDTTKPNVVNSGFARVIASGACAANQNHIYFTGPTTGLALNYDWTTALVKNNLQVAQPVQPGYPYFPSGLPMVTLSQHDAGGYMTLADVQNEGGSFNTFAQFAFLAGTNLRAAEYLYEIAFGTTLEGMEVTENVTDDMTPAFIPSDDPNFHKGNNQTACIACHGGGATNRLHGYAAFADIFDWSSNAMSGFAYYPNPIYTPNPMATFTSEDGPYKDPAEGLRKSFGSNVKTRVNVFDCIGNAAIQAAGTVCNPSSLGVPQDQGWDLSLWQTSGLLTQWGWNGPIKGSGVNALGAAVGQATGVYKFMTQRVVNEICPLGTITSSQIDSIVSQAMALESAAQKSTTHVPASQGAYGYIVEQVATDPSCI